MVRSVFVRQIYPKPDVLKEAVVQRCSVKKVFLRISQNSQENTCVSNFMKKETLAQVFFCEFCEISKNTLLNRTPPMSAFVFNDFCPVYSFNEPDQSINKSIIINQSINWRFKYFFTEIRKI